MGWTFRGQAFAVAADNPIFDEWFTASTEHTVDVVLGGSVRYVDIGGGSIAPLSVVAQWSGGSAAASRATLLSYLGTIGTLEDDDGRSCQALLSQTNAIRIKATNSGYVRMAITFVYVSS